MTALRVINAAEVRAALSWPAAIEAMRSAFGQLSTGAAEMPPRIVVPTRQGQTLVMPSYLKRSEDLAVKIVSVHPGNGATGLPLILGLVTVLDSATGAPLAVMDAASVTAMRTAAGSALATDFLAIPEADTLAVFGAGVQAQAHIEAIAAVRRLKQVRIFSRSTESAQRLAKALKSEMDNGTPELTIAASPAAAVRGAQIVVTATTACSPVFDGREVAEGTHVNAVGAWRPDCRELDDDLLGRARIVVDHRPAAWEEAGDLIQACHNGVITRDSVWAELGEIVQGLRPARQSPGEVTVFKSVGLAVQDAALAAAVLAEGERKDLGTIVSL